MRIKLSTTVNRPYLEVKAAFTEDLFMSLNPPFPPVKLLRFDGCTTNDVVSLELNFIFFKQQWVSLITEDLTDSQQFMFVDEGTKLPFFLRQWRHRHQIVKAGNQCVIVDDIQYKAPNWLLGALLYPALFLQFLYRKPIYKRLLGKKH